MTIQGRRMPNRDEVRSLILPKNGLANIDSRAPIPVTSARLFGARSIPTSELTFNARVTSNGARNSRQVPMYANVYSEMKPQPTRCGPSTVPRPRHHFLSPSVAGVPFAGVLVPIARPAQPRLTARCGRPGRRWPATVGAATVS